MKHTFISTLVLAVLLVGSIAAHAQATVSVVKYNGNTVTIDVDASGSISFAGDFLIIKESSIGSTQSFPMSSVRKLLFGKNSGIEDVVETKPTSLYPNPAHDYCIVAGAEGERNQVAVYTMSGAKLIDTQIETGEKLDLSNLQKGIYIVKINGTATKLCKW